MKVGEVSKHEYANNWYINLIQSEEPKKDCSKWNQAIQAKAPDFLSAFWHLIDLLACLFLLTHAIIFYDSIYWNHNAAMISSLSDENWANCCDRETLYLISRWEIISIPFQFFIMRFRMWVFDVRSYDMSKISYLTEIKMMICHFAQKCAALLNGFHRIRTPSEKMIELDRYQENTKHGKWKLRLPQLVESNSTHIKRIDMQHRLKFWQFRCLNLLTWNRYEQRDSRNVQSPLYSI